MSRQTYGLILFTARGIVGEALVTGKALKLPEATMPCAVVAEGIEAGVSGAAWAGKNNISMLAKDNDGVFFLRI